MGKVQGGQPPGMRAGENPAGMKRGWRSSARGAQGERSGCPALPAQALPPSTSSSPGHPIPCSVPPRTTRTGVGAVLGLPRVNAWQDWEPHACPRTPWCPHLPTHQGRTRLQ